MGIESVDILAGKTALVTGAGGGIGHQIALTLAGAGANIALHYNHTKPLQTVKKIELNNRGGTSCCFVQADFNNTNFAIALLDEVEAAIATPDILINCAASQDVATLQHMSDLDFSQLMKTNVNALFSLSNHFVKRLSSNQTTSSAIINISSIEASRPLVGHAHYATSKAAVEMLTKTMALEYGSKGLRVNAVAPGLIEREGIGENWTEGVKNWEEHCPLGRMGTPDDVAQAVLFLASPASKFITGAVLTVDGGMSVTPGW